MTDPAPSLRARLPRLSRPVLILLAAEPFIALALLLVGFPVAVIGTGLIEADRRVQRNLAEEKGPGGRSPGPA